MRYLCDEFVEECSCFPHPDFCDAIPVRIRPAVQKHLSRHQIRRIERLHSELIEFEPPPLQDWIFGVSFDPDPEQSIRSDELVLSVFQQIAARTELSLKKKRDLYEHIGLIAQGHRCVDPQSEIFAALPDFATIESMCRQARESYAVTSDA